MPQMQPFNWFLLFNFFNIIFILVGVKLSFYYKEAFELVSEKKEANHGWFIFNI